jgi:hemolysin activation/secretion protein
VRSARTVAAALALAALGAGAAAQAVSDLLPPGGDPLAARAGALAPPDAAAAPAAAAPAAGPAFRLGGVRLVGARALGEAELAPLWAPLVGEMVTLGELEALADAISARYRGEGYVLSQAAVPAQTVEDGVVEIAVVEGFVDRVAVTGGSPAAQASAARRFARAAEARPLDLASLERAVILSRETLGGGVETVIEPSAATFGAADLTVLIEPRPVIGFAAVDNRGSRLYGDVTATAGLSLFGALGGTERIDLLVSGDPANGRIGFGRADLALPLIEGGALDGGTFGFRLEGSRGEPSAAVPGLRLLSEEVAMGASLAVPFVRTRARTIQGRVGIEWRRSENLIAFGDGEETATDRLVVLEAGGSWDAADRGGGITIVDLGLRQGLDIGGAAVGRTGPAAGSPGFTRVFGRAARLQRLGADWTLLAEATGQISSTTLPDGERFALGGSTIGRGFAPGNTTGDGGLGGRLEIRRQTPFGTEGAIELYAFGEGGRAVDRSAARDGERREDLASAGFGARVDLTPWLTLTPEVARQLRGRPADRPGRDERETRAFLGVVARF